MNARILLTTLFCLICISSTGWTQDLRLDVRLGAQVAPDESVDFVANENSIPAQTLRLSSELLPNTRFVIEYGTDGFGEVTRHETLSTTFVRQRFLGGAEWGPTFFGFLRPFAGATFGYALGSLDLLTSQIRYHDYSHDFIGDLYLGTEATVDWGSGWFFTGGIRFGGRLQTAAEFDELSTERPEDDPWERRDPDLGSINPNGWYVDLGAGIGLRF